MKQVIVLMASIALGLFIFTQIMGPNGLYSSVQSVWVNEKSIRNMQVIGP